MLYRLGDSVKDRVVFVIALKMASQFQVYLCTTNPFALASTLKLSTYPRSVANVFMIGSSLGGYLSLVADPRRSMHATRIVNIFHPLDPLAQRIEPWIDPNVWSEALVSVPLGKLDFPLSSAPQPVSTSAFLERNASLTPRRFVSRFFESCDFCNR